MYLQLNSNVIKTHQLTSPSRKVVKISCDFFSENMELRVDRIEWATTSPLASSRDGQSCEIGYNTRTLQTPPIPVHQPPHPCTKSRAKLRHPTLRTRASVICWLRHDTEPKFQRFNLAWVKKLKNVHRIKNHWLVIFTLKLHLVYKKEIFVEESIVRYQTITPIYHVC